MIAAYHRPASLTEALTLVARAEPPTLPLGGGTQLSRGTREMVEVVDLQGLGLGLLSVRGEYLEIGATATLEQVTNSEEVPAALRHAAAREAPLNLRNAATVAGTVMVADGKSLVAGVLLALDSRLMIATAQPGTERHSVPATAAGQRKSRTSAEQVRLQGLGDLLPAREQTRGSLITGITVPLNAQVAAQRVSRTPMSSPIAFVAVARWPSGRVRAVVGGFGPSPLLAMDGVGSQGLEAAVQNSFHGSDDAFASAEYRVAVSAVLARRCAQELDLAARGPEAQA